MNEPALSTLKPSNAPTLVDMMFGSDPAALPLIRMLQRPVVIDANVLIEDAMRFASGRHCALQCRTGLKYQANKPGSSQAK